MRNIILSLLLLFGISLYMTSCVKEVTNLPDNTIKISYDTVRLAAGTKKQLVCPNYSASDLTWSSSDSTVSNVSTLGLITAYKPGVTVISVKSKAHGISATCTVTVVDAKVTDVGVGADGSVFVIGADSIVSATGGYAIYKLVNNQLRIIPDCAGIRIAVDPHGVPWVVNKSNLIYRYNGNTWDLMPGTGTDIGIGADGSVFAIGTQDVSPTGGFNIMKWNGISWDTMPDCAGIHIAVDPAGTPWVVNKSNIVFKYGGTYLWDPLYGVAGNDIGIGGDGSVYVTGKDSSATSYNPPVYQFSSNTSSWSVLPGLSGVSVSAGPTGQLWYTDKFEMLHKPQ